MNLLLVHGNGGANARFQLFTAKAEAQNAPYTIHLPKLPGFEGRPLPETGEPWSWFLEALAEAVEGVAGEWVYYGHGIGGSILLEWAKRGWRNQAGEAFVPKEVILHGIIGASLQYRFFPKLMKPKLMRNLIHYLISAPFLQQRWEKKLFLYPERIPADLRQQFFADYKRCAAFPVFFDLITPAWYSEVQAAIGNQPFHFLWGSRERVIASKFLAYWKNDFPNARFTIIEGWDHFPMLEQVDEFYTELTTLIETTTT
ncbi:MAG: alpha/beta hydrolase [Bacteroidota bacterium]